MPESTSFDCGDYLPTEPQTLILLQKKSNRVLSKYATVHRRAEAS